MTVGMTFSDIFNGFGLLWFCGTHLKLALTNKNTFEKKFNLNNINVIIKLFLNN